MQTPSHSSALVLAAFALLWSSGIASAETVVLRGARVLTMDDARPEGRAVAVVDGTVAAVGSAADVEPFLKGAKVYDLPRPRSCCRASRTATII